MADNVVANSGTGGATFATDEDTANSRHVPWVKLMEGVDGTFNEVGSANPLPVDASGNAVPVTDNGGSLTIDGTVTAELSATDNAVLDTINTAVVATQAAVEGTLTVDGSAVTQPVSGTVTANLSATDNAVLDAIETTSNAIQTAVEGTLTVDGSGVTQPVSGTVTANLGATDNAVLDNIDTNTDYGQQVGGGTEASALRVTLANNSTGVLSVDDGGSSLTVDGTVAVTGVSTAANQSTIIGHVDGIESLLTTIDTDTSSMNTDLGTVAGAVSGSEMQVDVVAALPSGSNAIGKLAANSGVDIGDVDVTSISAGSNLVGDVGISVRTSGGTTLYKNIDVDESEDQVKGSAGQIYWIHAINLAATPIYLKFYNATAASVTVGTTVPDLTFPVPSAGTTNGAGFNISIPNGIAFGAAITIAGTTGVADNNSGAPGANELVVNLGYA